MKQQVENRRCAKFVIVEGVRISVYDAAIRFGVDYKSLLWRIGQGEPLIKAIENSKNRKERNQVIDHDGKALTVKEWAIEIGIPLSTLQSRLSRGWDIHKALKK